MENAHPNCCNRRYYHFNYYYVLKIEISELILFYYSGFIKVLRNVSGFVICIQLQIKV
jgi:hypothetical protein